MSFNPPDLRLGVFDAHVDTLQRALDLGHDLGRAGPGHLDLERGGAGGLSTVVFVCWVDPAYIELGPGGAFNRTRELLGEFHLLCERFPDHVRFAGDAAEMHAAHADGCIAGIPGIEGGHSIEESLDNLQWFFERGVRVMTLVWNNHLSWVRSCQNGAGSGVPEGLSGFGRSVVRSMNELGMVVDLSHAGERSFLDALEESSRPVIASHSGCHALHEHVRNLSDAQLKALAENGGVMGVVFHPGFLDSDAQAEESRVRATEGYRSIKGENETDKFVKQSEYLEREAEPLAAERVIDHIVHAVEVAGIDHVGLGSDFDGIQRGPKELRDASCYGYLVERLLARGFDREDVRKVLGKNMERVYEQVTRRPS